MVFIVTGVYLLNVNIFHGFKCCARHYNYQVFKKSIYLFGIYMRLAAVLHCVKYLTILCSEMPATVPTAHVVKGCFIFTVWTKMLCICKAKSHANSIVDCGNASIDSLWKESMRWRLVDECIYVCTCFISWGLKYRNSMSSDTKLKESPCSHKRLKGVLLRLGFLNVNNGRNNCFLSLNVMCV